MNRRLLIWAAVVAAFVVAGGMYGWQRQAGGPAGAASVDGVVQDGSGRTALYWHDPMVPGHKFDKPGKSPFMDMQLVPQYVDEAATDGVRISAHVAQNLGIRIAIAETATFGDSLLAVGRIEADEHRLYTVQTRVAGYVERLYVRAVGDPVRAGQKLADVYAPELLAAQQEYLALLKLDGLPDAHALRAAARTRLTFLGMQEAEIDAVAAAGNAQPRYGLYAPAAGYVVELGMREGAQTAPGASLMQIAGFDTVWLIAEAPERDAARVKPGDRVRARVESLAGEYFAGRIGLLYPALDKQARTVRMRVELANRQNRLRPGMFATMELAGEPREALSVPAEAVIATGMRKLVIVKEGEIYRPSEVEVGAERDGRAEILKGLDAGEAVVVSGQFLIDSEASLRGVLARFAAPPQAAATSDRLAARGSVIEVDVAAGRITLDHEPIPALNWPRMTMGFKVREPGALGGIEVGDAVSFDLKRAPEGDDYVIERIVREAAR